MELISRTARLVPYAKRPKQVPSFVVATTYEPPVEDSQAHLGSLLIVIEVLVSGRPGEDVASLITSTFQDAYYSDDSLAQSSLARFEEATKATNHALSAHVNDGNAAWIGKLSAVIAVQASAELHVTHSGSAEAYLYRNQANTRITTGQSDRSTGPAKTFGMVASGQLEAGDRLLIATPALIHQIDLKRLHDIVASGSPESAIAELGDQLKGADVTRIAALVSEVTTPELAALQTRSEQPADVTIGAPESPIEAAKIIAAPLAQVTVATGKRASQVAQVGWEQSKPRLQQAARAATSAARAALTGQQIAKRALIVAGVVSLLGIGLLLHANSNRSKTALISRYKTDYAAYISASQISEADRQRNALTATLQDAKTLASKRYQPSLDHSLARATLADGTPRAASQLVAAIQKSLDALDGVVHVSTAPFTTLASDARSTNQFLELSSGNIYSVNAENSLIYVVNITTKSAKKTTADTSKVGKVVATTLSSNNDGIYLLTAQPSVWFYRFSSDSLSQLSLGLSGWEPATSISSYAGNLYLLSNGQIEKHVRTSTGFSPGSAYSSATSTIPSPSALSVNGFVYVSGTDGIYQFQTGSVKSSVNARSGLTSVSTLRSTQSNQLIGVNKTTNRVGVWSDGGTFSFVHQYELNGMTNLSDVAYDSSTQTFYAISLGRIVTFPAQN